MPSSSTGKVAIIGHAWLQHNRLSPRLEPVPCIKDVQMQVKVSLRISVFYIVNIRS